MNDRELLSCDVFHTCAMYVRVVCLRARGSYQGFLFPEPHLDLNLDFGKPFNFKRMERLNRCIYTCSLRRALQTSQRMQTYHDISRTISWMTFLDDRHRPPLPPHPKPQIAALKEGVLLHKSNLRLGHQLRCSGVRDTGTSFRFWKSMHVLALSRNQCLSSRLPSVANSSCVAPRLAHLYILIPAPSLR